MIFGVIVKEMVGVLLIVLGLLIWIKRKLSILHSYHYSHVKEEDIPAFARLMGIGMIVIGAGICTSGILDIFYSPYWWIPLVAGFVVGFAVVFYAMKKYNGSILG